MEGEPPSNSLTGKERDIEKYIERERKREREKEGEREREPVTTVGRRSS